MSRLPEMPTAGVHTEPVAGRPSPLPASPPRRMPIGPIEIDPRLIYARTDEGVNTIRERSSQVSVAAVRLLMALDGERSLSQVAGLIRPGDLPMLLRELEQRGLATLVGIRPDVPVDLATHPEVTLGLIKRSLAGVFELELGADASVLEARVQDCVSLEVLRVVLREVIGLVARRKSIEAAERIATIVKTHGPF